MGNWHGIMRVVELTHADARGNTIRKIKDIPNRVHFLGEDFILKVLFGGVQVPGSYFIGLDSRESIDPEDSISGLSLLEPSTYGYERQAISSNDFSVVQNTSGFMQANSPTVLFTALDGSWGPIRNIFLSTGLGHASPTVLVSSASIGQNLVVSPGETVSMRMAMSLSAC
jgi:hypothetical protein